ncbi:MAG: glycosyltransferase [Microcoleaceae cyanobacterium]
MNSEFSKLQKIQSQLNASLSRLQSSLTEPNTDANTLSLIAQAKLNRYSDYSILFYRDFGGFSGGHLKVWDYFNHTLASPNYLPYIYFYSDHTCWNNSNPWVTTDSHLILSQPLSTPDVIFIDGLDWLQFDRQFLQNNTIPIINLIQGMRHCQPDNPRYQFLKYKAIRICVSPEVQDSLQKIDQVNGPIFCIPNGIDTSLLPQPLNFTEKQDKILISAQKQPQLGVQLKQLLELQGNSVNLLLTPQSRAEYFNQINQAKIAIFLPNRQEHEGFYLPALEAMALGTFVICPDCIGNRSFCLPSYNCFRPNYTLEEIVNAVNIALSLSSLQFNQIIKNAKKIVEKHSLNQERQAFLEILGQIQDLWSQQE